MEFGVYQRGELLKSKFVAVAPGGQKFGQVLRIGRTQ
jgi:hypothetical protein